ncbi:MAG: DUF3592 domain-containing protein [Cyclobacteriaceae bacterium]|nr:DUF3592 domain-containing protein [Cyclobacteriaceae bacterium]
MKNLGCMVVFLIGLGLIAGAIFLIIKGNQFKQSAQTAEGVVIDLAVSSGENDTYAPVVQFVTTAGDTIVFTGSTYSDPPAYDPDEIVTVLYNPAEPAQAVISDFTNLYLWKTIMLVIGLVITVVGYYFMTADSRAKKKLVYYQRNGTKVEARLAGVEKDKTIRVNGEHPSYIVAEKTINGELIRFKSKSYLKDPSPYLEGIETIIVYLHPFKKDNYLMDTSFVPV